MGMPFKAAYTLEQEVLLSAIRADRNLDGHIRELLQGNIDWPALRHTALQHGVLPLFYSRLKELAPDLLPQQEMMYLQEFFRAHARQNLIMVSELVKVLRILTSHDISAIPFKGPVLAVQAYGDVCLRQFVDLDIMVRREDMKKAGQLLCAQGYRLWYAFTPAQEKSHLKRTCELTFLPEHGLAGIDMHWRFAADYFTTKLSQADTLDGRETVLLEGHTVPVMPADIMLLYLCLHGAFHLWPKLSTVCDVAMLIKTSPALNWQRLMHRAAAVGLRRTFLLGLGLAQNLMAANLPGEIAAAVAEDRSVMKLQEHIRTRLFSPEGREPGFFETAWFQLLAKDRFYDRFRYVLIRIFFPTIEDWRVLRLPDRFYFIYFFLRPLRLAGLLPSRT